MVEPADQEHPWRQPHFLLAVRWHAVAVLGLLLLGLREVTGWSLSDTGLDHGAVQVLTLCRWLLAVGLMAVGGIQGLRHHLAWLAALEDGGRG